MKLTARVEGISESVTLKLNSLAVKLSESGKKVYNLTAGQLPNMPMDSFVEAMQKKATELKSYQYSPAAGFVELRQNVVNHIAKSRNISFDKVTGGVDAIISNGAKHSLYNVLMATIEQGDEVILFAPYWISYTEMIKLCGGTSKIIKSEVSKQFVPDLAELRKAITPKTKMILVNSPNNPSGTHYPESWMKELAEILVEHPGIIAVSDEIYYELSYAGEPARYFYQYRPELLERTVIIDGISKTLACTGLRIGYIVAPKQLTKAIANLQGQTASGPNSMVQLALQHFGFEKSTEFLRPINHHLHENSMLVKVKLEQYGLQSCWYRSTSAFYYMVDFSKTPRFKQFFKEQGKDYADQMCQVILEELGVAMVPGSDFGMPNTGRIALVMGKGQLTEALDLLFSYLSKN